jgi:hypothetical protein
MMWEGASTGLELGGLKRSEKGVFFPVEWLVA